MLTTENTEIASAKRVRQEENTENVQETAQETSTDVVVSEEVPKEEVVVAEEEPATKKLKMEASTEEDKTMKEEPIPQEDIQMKEEVEMKTASASNEETPKEETVKEETEGKKEEDVKKPKVETRPPRERQEGEDPKLPKRKVAVMLGYCGTGYQGMQINVNAKTIEEELHIAFAAAGAVSKDNAMDPKKVAFMRAARTDKGVHALGQVVSMKMIIEDKDIVAKINQHLPEQIRIWDVVRTTNGFHCKNACDSRVYEYLMPTYVLQDCDPQLYSRSVLAQENNVEPKTYDFASMTEDAIKAEYRSLYLPLATPEEMAEKRAFRITQDKLELVRSLLKQYEGTHNFHNFTIGKNFKERSANRYILSFKCSEPFIVDGCEWLSLKVHGQSFMLHQIRKMVGLVIMMIRTKSPASLISNAFKATKWNIPKAPSLGLLLDKTVYTAYNKKWAPEGSDKEPIDFEKHRAEIDAFKQKHVYDKMVAEEMQNNEFEQWTRGVDSHHKEYEWYLTATGEPDETHKPPFVHESRPKAAEKAEASGDEE